jgi:hypothetical protein
MEKNEVIEYNHLTGETIERSLTEQEQADFEATLLVTQQYQAEQDAKIAARQNALNKLAALGLTQEEIEAL